MSTIITGTDIRKLQRRHRSLTGLLELIVQRIELGSEAYESIQRHYREKTEQLKGCPWLRQFELDMGPHGSVSTQTTVAPLERKHGEFDVDLILKVTPHMPKFTVEELHRRVGNRLRVDYAPILLPIRFGWKLDYAATERFHFDVVTAIPCIHAMRLMAAATDTKKNNWKPTNPNDYANDFLKTAASSPYIEDMEYRNAINEGAVLAKSARVTIAPLPENTVLKLPLQRNVQFVKRFRDIWFSGRQRLKERTPSIIVTTLLWRAYERHIINRSFPSMFAVFDTMIAHMIDSDVLRVGAKPDDKPYYSLQNPTVPDENLVERWNTTGREHEAVEFFAWVKDLRIFMKALADAEGMHRLQPLLNKSLGNTDVEPVFREIAQNMNPSVRPSPLYHVAGIGLTTKAATACAPAIRPHTFHGIID